jgi:hypothetical protein
VKKKIFLIFISNFSILESVVFLAQREFEDLKATPEWTSKRRSEAVGFREILLKKLSKFRAKKMGISRKEAQKGILSGIYSNYEIQKMNNNNNNNQ